MNVKRKISFLAPIICSSTHTILSQDNQIMAIFANKPKPKQMEKIVEFIMRYLKEVAHFFSHIGDIHQWTTDNLMAVAEYLFIGWIALLFLPRLLFRNLLLQLVAKIILVIILPGLLLWAHDPHWYEAYL